MMQEESAIKCVDLGKLGAPVEGVYDGPDEGLPDENLQAEFLRVGKEISNAFEDIGFVYLINHGIPERVITSAHKCGSHFFSLSEEIKMKYSKNSSNTLEGYVEMHREKFGIAVQEFRESYDIAYLNGSYPEEIPDFESTLSELTKQGLGLCKKLLQALELALGISAHTLLSAHKTPFVRNNQSLLRLLHYPPVPEQIDEGAVRCGTHSDYGTFTLLFQDDMGGLEVKDRDGIWQHADPISGSILINVGDLLEMWTSGRFVATKHRVLIPKKEIQKRSSRHSMVLFMNPDNDVLIKPFDGSNAYPPITAKQYLQKRYDDTYQY